MAEDSISPIPRNAVLGSVADTLTALRRFAKRAGPDAPFSGLAQALIGDSPEEIARWAEGDSPLRSHPLGSQTAFKPDRDMSAIGAAGMLPIGSALKLGTTAAAKTAALMPIIKGMNKVPAIEKALQSRVGTANEALRAGTMPEDIWRTDTVAPNPRVTVGNQGAKWMHETTEPPPVTPEMIARLRKGDTIPMREFRPDPELHTQYPWTGDTLVSARPLGPEVGAHYQAVTKDVGHRNGYSTPTIEYNSDLLHRDPAVLNGELTHEINHNINDITDQHATMGMQMLPLMPDAMPVAAKMPDILRAKGHFKLADHVDDIIEASKQGQMWPGSMGENVAELDRTRGAMSAADRAAEMPRIPEGGIPDNVSAYLGQILYGHGRNDKWSKFSRPDAENASIGLVRQLRNEVKNTGLELPAPAALYKGGQPDLYLGHATNVNNTMVNGELPQEFYNLSQSITKGAPPGFGGGDLKFIAGLGKFDPKTQPTVLSAFDNYTPRKDAGQGSRVDNLRDAFTQQGGALQDILDAAQARMADRFLPSFERGGAQLEGLGAQAVYKELPRYGQDPSEVMTDSPMFRSKTMHDLSQGPRFQSFKHYEDSPYGAKRLGGGTSQYEATRKADNVLDSADSDNYMMSEAEKTQTLKDFASDSSNPYQKAAQDAIKALRRTKSDYGELKSYGPTGINADNFAAILHDPNMSVGALRNLYKSAEKRGIPVYPQPIFDRDTTALIDWLHSGSKGDMPLGPSGKPLAVKPDLGAPTQLPPHKIVDNSGLVPDDKGGWVENQGLEALGFVKPKAPTEFPKLTPAHFEHLKSIEKIEAIHGMLENGSKDWITKHFPHHPLAWPEP